VCSTELSPRHCGVLRVITSIPAAPFRRVISVRPRPAAQWPRPGFILRARPRDPPAALESNRGHGPTVDTDGNSSPSLTLAALSASVSGVEHPGRLRSAPLGRPASRARALPFRLPPPAGPPKRGARRSESRLRALIGCPDSGRRRREDPTMTNSDDAKQFPIVPVAPSPLQGLTPASDGPEPPADCSGSLAPDGAHPPARPSSPGLPGEDAEAQGTGQPGLTATYSPEDNKLRLSSASRLDAGTYARVKAAGFVWAPKQGLFVAPMWTPERADLLFELCGEIGDEDTSLVDRAEQRAERFEGYSDNRTADAESARRAVAAIADNIPLGQPILVGHHSERHARRDAGRIEQGMRKAVRMWDTAEYWKRRAGGALRHARYKERPDVRFRRMKGLESELRKHEKHIKASEAAVQLWQRPGLTVRADLPARQLRSRLPAHRWSFLRVVPLVPSPRRQDHRGSRCRECHRNPQARDRSRRTLDRPPQQPPDLRARDAQGGRRPAG
jgi:hypothetical protein